VEIVGYEVVEAGKVLGYTKKPPLSGGRVHLKIVLIYLKISTLIN
jgi:hypothetical protein